MPRVNTAPRASTLVTHEGGKAVAIRPSEDLLRATASCMLFENTFYEGGDSVAARIANLVYLNTPERVAEVALLARNELKLRSVPLWLAVQMTLQYQHGGAIARKTIRDVVQRPDQMAEMVALFYKAKSDPRTAGLMGVLDRSKVKGGTKLPDSMKRGLADAFSRFNEYQLAKWNRLDREYKLRDVLFLAHPRALPNEALDGLWKRLVTNELATPDTWEVALSTGQDKKATWERLITEHKLGAVATIMNIRNMASAKVDTAIIREAIAGIGPRSRLLPFRFVAAAKVAPQFADELGTAMLRALEGYGRLAGKTALCIDISGSMGASLSERGTTTRAEAAAALGALLREVGEEVRVYVFGTEVAEVGNYHGMALVQNIGEMNARNVVGSGTNIAGAVAKAEDGNPDRIIIVTDEQGHTVPEKGWKGYIVNCASYAPGLETGGKVQRINGLSDRILDWVSFEETGAILTATEPDEVES